MKNILLQITGIILLFFIISICSYSQKYVLSGTIIDKNTREPLPGATISIQNTSRGASTNNDGYFKLDNINKQKITILVTYIGYEKYSLTHDFSEENKSHIKIALKPSSEELKQVDVIGKTDGQVKAMLKQKNAETIKNIISSEQISEFPDMNAAEAMSRIPGITLQRDQGEGRYVQLRGTPPEYTSFNINGEQIPSPEGNVRYVGMDIISADQIDEIEINKMSTPDMDGDAIGGAVNVITKKAKSEVPEINASFAGGYNNLRETDNYQVQFSYGQRYKKFGFYMNGSYFINNYGSDNMEFEYKKSTFYGSQSQGINNYHMQYDEVQLRHYTITRKRTGFSGAIDYEFNDHSFLYIRGMYNQFSDDELRRRKIYKLDDALSEKYYVYGGIEHDIKDRTKIQNLNSINFGGEHVLFGATIDYETAYSYASENQPDRIEAIFENPGQAVQIKFDMSDPDWPKATFPKSSFSDDVFNYDQYEFDELLFQTVDVSDQNITSKMNIKIPYSFSNHKGCFKFGGKIRFKEKTVDLWGQEFGNYGTSLILRAYVGPAPEFTLSDVRDDFRTSNFLNKGYTIEAMPSPEKIRDYYEFYPQFFVYDRDETREESYDTDFQVSEDITATYAMFKHNIGKFMFLGGARYENTYVEYEARKAVRDSISYKYIKADTTNDSRNISFLLPNLQIKYKLTNDFNLRTGIAYSFSRPNLDDVVPYREEDRKEVRYGNPDLEYPSSINIELSAERYLQGDGILSAGFFYKKIDHYIYTYVIRAHEKDPGMGGHRNRIEIPLNGTKAFVYGGELQAQFKFSFLPGFLSDFGIFTNYSYTLSEASLYKRYPANDHKHQITFGEDYYEYFNTLEEETISLPGQAKHTANMAFFYESKRLYVKLSSNYHDDFLYQLGEDPDFDVYYAKALRFDFTANYSFLNHLKVFVDLINITNTPLKYYIGNEQRIKQHEFYSWWGRIGLKYHF